MASLPDGYVIPLAMLGDFVPTYILRTSFVMLPDGGLPPVGVKKSPVPLEQGIWRRCLCGQRLTDFGLGYIDLERAIGQGIGVEHADGLFCFGLLGHGHESKAF